MGALFSTVALLLKIPLTLIRLIGGFLLPDLFLNQAKLGGKRVLITGGGLQCSPFVIPYCTPLNIDMCCTVLHSVIYCTLYAAESGH